ncbi:uncharacterized protein BX664DRAFT_338303 [Halteromyces radiatus]|uniref:uncharacterized protein n=1 Tax=Halteromyces radiatus TaxID=101107 RepID=UPI00221E5634|nr:uncharacterized protein BX664DRAFT_338303 [Halteromyces radiatus]KAI8084999.1 hypothetical protein BX664DRAFT_338303 [Halteromyces radiatus]
MLSRLLSSVSKTAKFNTLTRLYRKYSTVVNPNNAYDVVIVGGGVAGTALACSIASNPLLKDQRIALIEAMDLTNTLQWSPQQDIYSNRTVSLTPGSMAFLKRIGATHHLSPGRANPYTDMQVWDGVTGARIHFDATSLNPHDASNDVESRNTIAYMIENTHLQHALLKRLEQCRAEGAQVDILQRARVSTIEKEPMSDTDDGLDLSDWPVVHLENKTKLHARLLIGADGINSPVRKFACIESLGWDYDAHGVVATLKLDSLDHQTAWQRFLPTGPIAMLPMGEGYASMVWSTKPHLAKLLKTISEEDFVQLVNAAFRLSHVDLDYFYKQLDNDKAFPSLASEVAWRDDVINKSTNEILPPKVVQIQQASRASFPLKLRNSERYISDRVALVGDAAHTTHPLAGQGLNQGLLDVESLTNVLVQGTLEGQDIGNINLLRGYASDRYIRNIVMISACDKMHRLFGTDAAPIAWLRSFGLSTLNNLDSVKSEIMKYAMGVEYTGATSSSSQ